MLQFRLVEVEGEDGLPVRTVKPYICDLESTNGTFLNGERLVAARMVELVEGDTLNFGTSTRDYTLLHDQSTG